MTNAQSATAFTTFGELLRHLRRRACMTQRDLGQATGYSEAQIARLEGGSRLPDVVAVKGVFVEALGLKREPALSAQLVALAQAARDSAVDTHADVPTALQPTLVQHSHATSGNLPVPATTLIGREDDIAAVTQYIAESKSRIVSFVGPGGVGKTQLALEVANQIQDGFPDGAWWVDLAPIIEPQAALTSVAQALEIEDRPGKPILRVLQDHLRDRHALLVLDNLEQVLEVAPLISQMLSATPKVKVLATSRELLRIAGEQGFTVSPLGEDAIDLFVQRAKAVKPDFALTEANAGAIAEICRKLDGLPLAIELAAARITLFTPKEMLNRLDQRLSLLTSGARDLPARQRTLRATIEWSFNLLTENEQALFLRLSVFAGGYTLHGAQYFCDADHLPLNAVDGLMALVAKSLVVREEFTVEPDAGNMAFMYLVGASERQRDVNESRKARSYSRYRILETIREYACAQLMQRGEYDRWIRRLAEYLLLIQEIPDRPLPEERENCMVALRWLISVKDDTNLALRLATHCDAFTQDHHEVVTWLEHTLNGVGDSSDLEPRMFAHAVQAAKIGDSGNRSKAISLLQESLAWYEANRSDSEVIHAHFFTLGHMSREIGNVDASRDYFSKALQEAHKHHQFKHVRHTLITWSETEVADEKPYAAEELLDVALTVPLAEDILMTAWALNHRAHAAQIRGDFYTAKALLEQSLRLFSQSPYQQVWGHAWGCHALGEIALSQGQPGIALEQFSKSIADFDRVADIMGVCWCLAGLAGAHALNEEPKFAARLWGASEAWREQFGFRIAPASRQNRERTVAMLNAQLGEAEFARLAAEGAAWTLDQAVEAALHTPAGT